MRAGGAANSNGVVRVDAVIGAPGPPEDSDIRVTVSVTDVRCKTAIAACGAANAAGGADYTGELTPNAEIRVTDNFNGIAAGGGAFGATGQDFLLGGTVQVPCAATASTAIGSSCTCVDDVERHRGRHGARRQARGVAARPGRGARRRLRRRSKHDAERTLRGPGHLCALRRG